MGGELRNAIGNRGELLFELALTDFSLYQTPLFAARHLGEKWPDADFYVEVRGLRGQTPVCLVQVKTTATSPRAQDQFILTKLTKKSCSALSKLPVPTYLAVVDEQTGKTYLKLVDRSVSNTVSKVSLANELTPVRLKELSDEIALAWSGVQVSPSSTKFP